MHHAKHQALIYSHNTWHLFLWLLLNRDLLLWESLIHTHTTADISHAVNLTNHISAQNKWDLQKKPWSDSKQIIAITLNTSLKDLLPWSPVLTDRLGVCRPAVLFWHRLVVMCCRLCVAGRVMIYISRVTRRPPGKCTDWGKTSENIVLFNWTGPGCTRPHFITCILNISRLWLRLLNHIRFIFP